MKTIFADDVMKVILLRFLVAFLPACWLAGWLAGWRTRRGRRSSKSVFYSLPSRLSMRARVLVYFGHVYLIRVGCLRLRARVRYLLEVVVCLRFGLRAENAGSRFKTYVLRAAFSGH